jgi:chromosome segregation ATPase
MSEETTQNIPDGRSFEERVFARLDSIDARFDSVDTRLDSIEARLQSLEDQAERRALETKPIWERALQEIMETRRELSKRLDRIEAIAHETRADLRDAEDRIESLESKSS